MVQYDPLQFLPTEEDLPDSDDTPVDNGLQTLIPTLLRAILALYWKERSDWFFGVNLGLYYNPKLPAIVPDGFLSLGVPRYKSEWGRLSYLIWQENGIVPCWVLEAVSQTYGGEYDSKMSLYAELGVLYYTIYNPYHWRRDRHESFEVYQLQNGQYVRLTGEPVWLPELGLAIGRGQGTQEGWKREWLYWYTAKGDRLFAPENVIQQERQRAEQAEQQLEQERQERQRLLNKLRQQGIDPDRL